MSINLGQVVALASLSLLVVAVTETKQAADFSTILGETSTARLFRTRGYIARDYYVKVQNGEYTLNVVRVTNPLINDGLAGLPHLEPVLLVHGAIQNANGFALINDKVRPKNYSGFNISSLSIGQLRRLVRGDQGAQSIAFTLLNFGYEIYLLNRRQTYESRRAQGYGVPFDTKDIDDEDALRAAMFQTQEPAGLDADEELEKSLDLIGSVENEITNNLQDLLSGQLSTGIQGAIGPYWNFSQDPQAQHDIPEIISFVLAKTKRPKLVYLGYSQGTTLLLMSLTDYPDLADKISRVILWAPLFDLPYGFFGDLINTVLGKLAPVTASLQAPLPSQDASTAIDVFTEITCASRLLKPVLCTPFLELMHGPGVQQNKAEYLTFENRWFQPSSSMELSQYQQAIEKTTMHRFDFGNRQMNLRAYGQLEPPEYDISKIRHRRISVYLGNTDRLGQIGNFNFTRQRLTVPIDENIIDISGIQWNHFAPLIHKDNTNLIILPTVIKIAQP